MERIELTPGQMVAMGDLVKSGRLVEPDSDSAGYWPVERIEGDDHIRLRDIERDYYISPGGGWK